MRWGLALVAVLAFGACSGDDDSSALAPTTSGTATDTSTDATPAPTASSSPTSTATRTTPPTTASATTMPATTPITTVAATTPATSPGASDEWCLRAAELNQLASAFRELDATDRDAVEAALDVILDRLERIEAVVATQLAADLAVSAEAFRLLEVALDAVDYDMAAADFTQLDARRAAIVAANSRIRVYNHDECGLDAGVTGAEVP